MSLTSIQNFIDSYSRWIAENTNFSEINGCVSITTPFLDRYNDRLEIYIKPSGDSYILTDDGQTLSELEMSGVSFNTEKRREILQSFARANGVQTMDGALVTKATELTFPQRKHALIQAMLSINDMFMLAQPTVANVFLEDVNRFLDAHDIRYISSVDFLGKSGLPQKFDLVIPASKKMPERILKVSNAPSRQWIESTLFSWNDVRDVRPKAANLFVFLNDTQSSFKSDFVVALDSYGAKPLLWSKRESYVSLLSA